MQGRKWNRITFKIQPWFSIPWVHDTFSPKLELLWWTHYVILKTISPTCALMGSNLVILTTPNPINHNINI
jgi:hypothetical protein